MNETFWAFVKHEKNVIDLDPLKSYTFCSLRAHRTSHIQTPTINLHISVRECYYNWLHEAHIKTMKFGCQMPKKCLLLAFNLVSTVILSIERGSFSSNSNHCIQANSQRWKTWPSSKDETKRHLAQFQKYAFIRT